MAPPHAQLTLNSSGHGRHGPSWHVAGQRWLLQCSVRPHSCRYSAYEIWAGSESIHMAHTFSLDSMIDTAPTCGQGVGQSAWQIHNVTRGMVKSRNCFRTQCCSHLAARRTVAVAAAGSARVAAAVARAAAPELAAQRLAAGHRLVQPAAGAGFGHRSPAGGRAGTGVAPLRASMLPAGKQLVAGVAAGGRCVVTCQVHKLCLRARPRFITSCSTRSPASCGRFKTTVDM